MGRFTYDRDDAESILDAVIDAIESVRDGQPGERGALYSEVDPDALARVLASLRRSDQPDGIVEFPFDEYWVTVTAGGAIVVRREPDPRPPVVSSRDEFRAAIGGLLREAATNGVDVVGNWVAGGIDTPTGWDVDITEAGRDDHDRSSRTNGRA
jgi:hypothetical protein